MAVFLQPIYTQTVGSGGAASITFNNIPQTFTDLKLVVSARSSRASFSYDGFTLTFNGSSSNYSGRRLSGNGSTASSAQSPYTSYIDDILGVDGASATSNTFGNIEFYIPNYTGSNFKQVIIDSVIENNATEAYAQLAAGLWRDTSAISSLSFGKFNADFVQYTTASLYGILRSGV